MFYPSGWRGGGVGKDLTRHSRFKRGRGSGGQNQPSLARNERGRVGVAGNTLRLAFRAREGQWWAERALPHSKREREGGRGRKYPPTRVSSEGGAVVGRISPPSLETREEGWAWLLVHAKCRDEGRIPPRHVGIYPNDVTRREIFLVVSVVSVDNGKKKLQTYLGCLPHEHCHSRTPAYPVLLLHFRLAGLKVVASSKNVWHQQHHRC